MNLVERRRAKISPDQQRVAQAEARRQIAMAVSLAEKKVARQMEAALNEAEAEKTELVAQLEEAERQVAVELTAPNTDVGKS